MDSNELARAARKLRSKLDRKDLKRRMNPYDKLATKSKTLPSDFRYESETTVHDILSNIGERRYSLRRRRSRVSEIINEIQVSDQIKAAWIGRLNPQLKPLSQEVLVKLQESAKNLVTTPTYDELKLIGMVSAILRVWQPRNKLT